MWNKLAQSLEQAIMMKDPFVDASDPGSAAIDGRLSIVKTGWWWTSKLPTSLASNA
jgi:hypothetical protein